MGRREREKEKEREMTEIGKDAGRLSECWRDTAVHAHSFVAIIFSTCM